MSEFPIQLLPWEYLRDPNSQTQLDMDGVRVGISRQALQETLDYLDRLQAKAETLGELLRQSLNAVNAAYLQAGAEFRGHDHIAAKHDNFISEWRKAARAALGENKGGER